MDTSHATAIASGVDLVEGVTTRDVARPIAQVNILRRADVDYY